MLYQVSRPNAEVRWYKGRLEIHSSDKYTLISDGYRRALKISCCSFEDEKKYTCDADDVRTTAKLSVEGTNGQVKTISGFFILE